MTTENTWKDAANPEFKQESTTNFAFKTPTKTFKTLAKPIKRLQIWKSGSNVLFLILPWSCPVVNNSFLNLDLHFRRWTTAMVKVRRATMFPNPKEKQKTYADIYSPHRHCNRIAGWIHRTMFFWKQPNRLLFRETPSFSSTNHIIQKFLVEWRSRYIYIYISYLYIYTYQKK